MSAVLLISLIDNKTTFWPLCVKGYIPRMTASRHLIGKDSLIISLAVSINLEEEEEEGERRGKQREKRNIKQNEMADS